jgi:sugar lactone lactonase YvrE
VPARPKPCIRIFVVRAGLLLCTVLSAAPAFAADQVDALAARVNAAYHAHQYAAMEADVGKLLKLLPGFPQGIYFLAIARAGQGDRAGSVRALDRLADMGLHFDTREQAVLKGLRGAPGFAAVEQRFAANLKQVGSAEPAFELAGKDFLPEGIAHDPDSGDFFVSSVHLRKIVRVHRGHAGTFADRGSGLDGVLGIRVDAARGVLWATSAALPQMQGYDPKDEGRTALFRFDLRDGTQPKMYRLPAGGGHQLNDLDVAPDGTVYVADSNGGIYVLKPDAARLEPLTSPGALRSSQGLALSPDGHRLYVADYAGGLFVVDPRTRRLTRVGAPSDVCVYGIDGLSMDGDDLVATQNGIQPQRIVRYLLGDKGLAIKAATVLDANDPRVPEPTLLTVANHVLYVVANSQWSRFDDQGRPKEGSVPQAPRIVKLALH